MPPKKKTTVPTVATVASNEKRQVFTAIKAKAPIKETTKPTSTEKVTPLSKGTLSKHGYSSKHEDVSRHLSLLRAVKEYGANHVIDKLQAVARMNWKRRPELAKIFTHDATFVRERAQPKKPITAEENRKIAMDQLKMFEDLDRKYKHKSHRALTE